MSTPPSPPINDAAPLPDAPLPVLGTLTSRWEPPTDGSVVTHTGEPIPVNRVYLAAPPDEIGTVISAASNLETGKGADGQVGKRILSALGGAVIGMAILLYISYRGNFSFDLTLGIIFYGLVGIIGAIVGFVLAKPKYQTSYVGEQGVASFLYGGQNKTIGKADIFRFDNATILHTQMTRHYRNGIYTGTTYSFDWHDAAGRTTHKYAGRFAHKDGNPPADDPYWFGIAAENAWSYSRLAVFREKLANGETVSFPIKGKGAVGISLRGLVIEMNGKKETVPLEELGDFGIKNGEVTIARRDAKKGFLGMGTDGIYKFSYAGLGNARLFLNLLSAASQTSEMRPEGS